MRSKRRFSLLVLLALLFMMVPLASADLGTPVNSRWAYTIPTIDGAISSGEWTDATVVNFTLDMRNRITGLSVQNLSARFYVKNDYTNIYAAVQIFNEDYDARDAGARYDGLFLLFEDDHDHTLEVGDNGEGVTTWASSPFYTKNDLYYDGSSWVSDVDAGQTNDGALSWSHTNATTNAIGNYTFEMRIPLVGTDGDNYDLAITLPPKKTVGYKIWFFEGEDGTDGVYPDDPGTPKNLEEVENGKGNTFGNLILHPLYYLTITKTAGGTTSPAPGKYPYGYGTIVNVLATPDSGYIFDHWEFDGSNVGPTPNPYQVTMNKNHTLHAVFESAPPVVGGMAAPIIIPISEPNLLTPLIWLVSAIIPIALTVAFVKLKKKKL